MARPCSICKHAARSDIEAAIIGGVPFRNITQRFATSISAISRHSTKHMKAIPEAMASDPRVIEAQENAAVETVQHLERTPKVLEGVLNNWQMLQAKFSGLLSEAEGGLDLSSEVLKAIRALERRDKLAANSLLEMLQARLAGDRADRRATLRELRMLASDQVRAWKDVADTLEKPEPLNITWRVEGPAPLSPAEKEEVRHYHAMLRGEVH